MDNNKVPTVPPPSYEDVSSVPYYKLNVQLEMHQYNILHPSTILYINKNITTFIVLYSIIKP